MSGAATDATSGRAAADRDLEEWRPIPDVLDRRGRLRRFAIAAAFGALAAVFVGTGSYGLARADLESSKRYLTGGAGRFVVFCTLAAWASVYLVARWWLDRRAARSGLLPTASVRGRGGG
jgi:hypothetical protein